MNKRAFLWMDHVQATMFCLKDGMEVEKKFKNSFTGRERTPGESANDTHGVGYRNGNNEYHQHRYEENQLKQFYSEIAEALQPFEEIQIMGPGTAKTEFRRMLLDKKSAAAKEILLETADELTQNQLSAQARKFLFTES